MKKIIVFLGQIRSGEYESIKATGARLAAILDTSRNAKIPVEDDFEYIINHDFRKPASELIAVAKELNSKAPINAFLNFRESYVREHAVLNGEFGFKGIDEHSVPKVLNKTLMREAFVRHLGSDCTANFENINDETQLMAFADCVGFPLVLKPTCLAASLFVTVVREKSHLIDAYRNGYRSTLHYIEQHGIKVPAEGLIQAEEFLQGPLYSIDALVDSEGNAQLTPMVGVITGNDRNYGDFHHFERSVRFDVAPHLRQEAATLAVGGIAALGLKNCVAHVEFVATPKGARLLEIAARPGAHRNRLMEKTFGVSLNLAYYRMVCGEHVKLDFSKPLRAFSIVTPFPRKVIPFEGIKRLADIQSLKTYKQHEIKVKNGDQVGPARSGFYSTFQIELESNDLHSVLSDVKTIERMENIFNG